MKENFWELLRRNRQKTSMRRIGDLFAEDKTRFEKFSIRTEDLILDYSKTNIDCDAKNYLVNLAKFESIKEKTKDMFLGKEINVTEKRAALHTALRNLETPLYLDGRDINLKVNQNLQKVLKFSEKVRQGRISSSSGKPYTDVVNIGIGGSDLGPKMVSRALSPYHDGPRIHFVSNLDSSDLIDTISDLDPRSTLFIISSKSFTTQETLTNAKTAKKWIVSELGLDGLKNFVAVSCAKDKALEFGVLENQIFEFEEWVGGRFSVWGPIGMPVIMAVGTKIFRRFLVGASSMDKEFRNSEIVKNLPTMWALIGFWHSSICLYPSRAILPYEHRLKNLPIYLQQLDMESNGKSVDRNGKRISTPCTPISWGQEGTNGQHAFYQFLHQSNQVVPCDFILGANCFEEDQKTDHHEELIAHCLAQSEALMTGIYSGDSTIANSIKGKLKNGEKLETLQSHLVCTGNRPSVTLIYSKLTPEVLGKLLALLEHRTFVEGLIWNLNSFDQWGVELGKKLAKKLANSIKGYDSLSSFSKSTRALVAEIKRLQG